MSDSSLQLSAHGAERRASILRLALRESRNRRRRRRIARGTALVLIGTAGYFAVPTRHEIPVMQQPIVAVIPAPPQQSTSHVLVEFIQSDPAIVERLSIKPQPQRWNRIGDEELLQTLASIGRPAGIIRLGDETRLMPRGDDPEQ